MIEVVISNNKNFCIFFTTTAPSKYFFSRTTICYGTQYGQYFELP